MSIKSSSLGLSAGVVAAVAFGICGLFFAAAPGPTAAFVGWALHLDVTAMARPVSFANLVTGMAFLGAYVGVLVGVTAAVYNRLVSRPAA